MAFSYKRSVTVDHTKVASNQSDFPMLVSFTHNDLRTTGNGGHVQNANGYDICFYSDSAGTTALYWEMERYNAATGEVIAWVKIPTLSSTVDDVIYIFYGDSGISTFQSTASSVWDSNFKGVWHFGDGTTLSTNDSTTNGKNATAGSYSATSGKVDGAALQSGTSYMAVSNSPLDGLTAFSLEACLYNTSGASGKAFMSDWSTVQLLWRNEGSNQLRSIIVWTDGSTDLTVSPSGYANNTWTKVAITYDGTTVRTYSNGVAGSTSAASGKTVVTHSGSNTLNFGGGPTGSEDYWSGSLDEFRISNVARSADWISTEYANQNSPGTFFTLGSEEGTSITGTASITQAAQTVSSAGTVAIDGTASITQTAQSTSAAGTVAIAGVAAITQEADSVTSAGVADIAGAAAITQATQAVAASGTGAIAGAAAITQSGDTLSAAGGETPNTDGAASITQAGQTVVAAGTVAIAGTATLTQGAFTVSAAGTVVDPPSTTGPIVRKTVSMAAFRRTVSGAAVRQTVSGAARRITVQ